MNIALEKHCKAGVPLPLFYIFRSPCGTKSFFGVLGGYASLVFNHTYGMQVRHIYIKNFHRSSHSLIIPYHSIINPI